MASMAQHSGGSPNDPLPGPVLSLGVNDSFDATPASTAVHVQAPDDAVHAFVEPSTREPEPNYAELAESVVASPQITGLAQQRMQSLYVLVWLLAVRCSSSNTCSFRLCLWQLQATQALRRVHLSEPRAGVSPASVDFHDILAPRGCGGHVDHDAVPLAACDQPRWCSRRRACSVDHPQLLGSLGGVCVPGSGPLQQSPCSQVLGRVGRCGHGCAGAADALNVRGACPLEGNRC